MGSLSLWLPPHTSSSLEDELTVLVKDTGEIETVPNRD
jgi:hypothetical protein